MNGEIRQNTGGERKVHLLEKSVYERIAAGEVVDRPVSVVKELVENSLDASASRIRVEIRGGGKELIQVVDDGCGMSSEDLRLAVQRFATSKIKEWEDLDNLYTLGFRGEALPSIAAVSRLEIRTCLASAMEGSLLTMEGASEPQIKACAAVPGTRITVRDLFFNTPARLKFLRSPSAESTQIIDLVGRLAAAWPETAFSVSSNGKEVFSFTGDVGSDRRLAKLWKLDPADFIPLFGSGEGITLDGFIAKPSVSKTTRLNQLFVMNGRVIRSQSISQAMLEGFSPLMERGHFPVGMLRLTVDPAFVDVNVHPTKLEVRFADPHPVFSLVYRTVSEALEAARADSVLPKHFAALAHKIDREQEAIRTAAEMEQAAGELAARKPGEGTVNISEREAGIANFDAGSGGGRVSPGIGDADHGTGSGRGNGDFNASPIRGQDRTFQLPRWQPKMELDRGVGSQHKRLTRPEAKAALELCAPFAGMTRSDALDSGTFAGSSTEPCQISAGLVRPVEAAVARGADTEIAGVEEASAQVVGERSTDAKEVSTVTVSTKVTGAEKVGQIEQVAPEPMRCDPAQPKLVTFKKEEPERNQLCLIPEQTATVSKFQVLGQVYNTFIVGIYEGKLWLVDQHTAQERINYEKFAYMRVMSERSQGLLIPEIVEFSPAVCQFLQDNLDGFAEYGYEVESFGPERFALRAVPAALPLKRAAAAFKDMVEDLAAEVISIKGNQREYLREKIRAMASCKASVRAGEPLGIREMEGLVNDMLKVEHSLYCPHGRPTRVILEEKMLERLFHRI